MSEERSKAVILEKVLTEFEQRTGVDNDIEEDILVQYAWEKDVDKSWEQLVDRDGVLQFIQSVKRLPSGSAVDSGGQSTLGGSLIRKKGIIRNIVCVFDMGESMHEMDFKPDRLFCAFGVLKDFIKEVFNQGPITQMALIGMRDRKAVMISQLGINPGDQIGELHNAIKGGAVGPVSLQNGLEMSLSVIADLPQYTTREILVIFGSTRTLDPGNILATLEKLKSNNICVSAISLTPEMYILKHICDETGGSYAVAKDKEHLRSLLNDHTKPPAWSQWMEPVLTKVGFPPLKSANIASLCICHSRLTYRTYICPQCHGKSCSIPAKCKCCGLYLVSPPDISRTFHHLIPPKPFTEVSQTTNLTTNNVTPNNN